MRSDRDMLSLVVTCIFRWRFSGGSWEMHAVGVSREKFRVKNMDLEDKCDRLLYRTGGITKNGGLV